MFLPAEMLILNKFHYCFLCSDGDFEEVVLGDFQFPGILNLKPAFPSDKKQSVDFPYRLFHWVLYSDMECSF